MTAQVGRNPSYAALNKDLEKMLGAKGANGSLTIGDVIRAVRNQKGCATRTDMQCVETFLDVCAEHRGPIANSAAATALASIDRNWNRIAPELTLKARIALRTTTARLAGTYPFVPSIAVGEFFKSFAKTVSQFCKWHVEKSDTFRNFLLKSEYVKGCISAGEIPEERKREIVNRIDTLTSYALSGLLNIPKSEAREQVRAWFEDFQTIIDEEIPPGDKKINLDELMDRLETLEIDVRLRARAAMLPPEGADAPLKLRRRQGGGREAAADQAWKTTLTEEEGRALSDLYARELGENVRVPIDENSVRNLGIIQQFDLLLREQGPEGNHEIIPMIQQCIENSLIDEENQALLLTHLDDLEDRSDLRHQNPQIFGEFAANLERSFRIAYVEGSGFVMMPHQEAAAARVHPGQPQGREQPALPAARPAAPARVPMEGNAPISKENFQRLDIVQQFNFYRFYKEANDERNAAIVREYLRDSLTTPAKQATLLTALAEHPRLLQLLVTDFGITLPQGAVAAAAPGKEPVQLPTAGRDSPVFRPQSPTGNEPEAAPAPEEVAWEEFQAASPPPAHQPPRSRQPGDLSGELVAEHQQLAEKDAAARERRAEEARRVATPAPSAGPLPIAAAAAPARIPRPQWIDQKPEAPGKGARNSLAELATIEDLRRDINTPNIPHRIVRVLGVALPLAKGGKSAAPDAVINQVTLLRHIQNDLSIVEQFGLYELAKKSGVLKEGEHQRALGLLKPCIDRALKDEGKRRELETYLTQHKSEYELATFLKRDFGIIFTLEGNARIPSTVEEKGPIGKQAPTQPRSDEEYQRQAREVLAIFESPTLAGQFGSLPANVPEAAPAPEEAMPAQKEEAAPRAAVAARAVDEEPLEQAPVRSQALSLLPEALQQTLLDRRQSETMAPSPAERAAFEQKLADDLSEHTSPLLSRAERQIELLTQAVVRLAEKPTVVGAAYGFKPKEELYVISQLTPQISTILSSPDAEKIIKFLNEKRFTLRSQTLLHAFLQKQFGITFDTKTRTFSLPRAEEPIGEAKLVPDKLPVGLSEAAPPPTPSREPEPAAIRRGQVVNAPKWQVGQLAVTMKDVKELPPPHQFMALMALSLPQVVAEEAFKQQCRQLVMDSCRIPENRQQLIDFLVEHPRIVLAFQKPLEEMGILLPEDSESKKLLTAAEEQQSAAPMPPGPFQFQPLLEGRGEAPAAAPSQPKPPEIDDPLRRKSEEEYHFTTPEEDRARRERIKQARQSPPKEQGPPPSRGGLKAALDSFIQFFDRSGKKRK